MSPKVLVLDLDGTTLTTQKRVSPRDVAAVRALIDHGVQVTIATGRLFSGTQWVAETLGITGSVAILNGSEIVDAQTGVRHHGCYVPPPSRDLVRRALAASGLDPILFHSERIHHPRHLSEHAWYLAIWTPQVHAHDDVCSVEDWHAHEVLGVCALGDPERIAEAAGALERALPSGLGVEAFSTWFGPDVLLVRSALENKGTALARLAADRSASIEDCVVVGDWLNDLPMLRSAARSFAMGHALDVVKEAADEVLAATSERGGGVAEVVERVWGLSL